VSCVACAQVIVSASIALHFWTLKQIRKT
jgi:hypothetical protein